VPQMQRHVHDLVRHLSDALTDGVLFEEALCSLGDQFFRELPMLPGDRFTTDIGTDAIDQDTILERPPQAICRVLENDSGAAIEFAGNRVAGPRRIAPILRHIASTSRFAIRELPDDIGANANVVLVRRLIREGLLTVCGHEKPVNGRLPVEASREAAPAGDRPASDRESHDAARQMHSIAVAAGS